MIYKNKRYFMKHYTMGAFLSAAILAISGCASDGKKPAAESKAAAEEPRIVGNIPANSPFAKVQLGMSQGQVHELIGHPTDTVTYSTGKQWIPFYFGNDAARLEELYKGLGTITFTGAGIGGVNYKVYRVVYDPSEDGYPNNR
jgi:hypothetical protein